MSSLGVSIAMTNVTPPTKKLGDQNMTFDSVVNHVSSERGSVLHDTSGRHCKPKLAVSKIHLEGNKNEIGSLDGFSAQVRDENKENVLVQVDTIAGASDSVSTADSHVLIHGNYDLNSLQLTECDDIPVAASNSENFNVVTNQRHKFGFCPLSKLQLYTGESVKHSTTFTDLQAHKLVKASGKPNFLGCRIPVQSNLNIASWRAYLSEYWDAQLLDLLEFGFPLDFQRDSILVSTEKNHTSALQNLQHVQAYIEEELSFKAMLGPFDHKPIPLHVSPLMVRDKQDSSKKRTIMDLSWPKGASVNAHVQKDIYLGTQYALNYPSIDSITDSLCNLGPAAKIYKVDISRAFRQIKIDPLDIDLLGLTFQNQYFIDKSVPFGYRNGSQIFQRCTDAIRFTMQQHGFPHLFNYIDDLIYTGLPSQIHSSYQFLLELLQELGLEIFQKKLVPPDTVVTCLGIQIDTVNRTLSIPHQKLQEIVKLCKDWVNKTYCSKKALQSLLGSLLYISKCVKPARFFLNHILALLRSNYEVQKILLDNSFFKDLTWFNTFLCNFNGVTYYHKTFPSAQVYLDACLTA